MARSKKIEPAGKAARILDAARDAFFEQDYDAVTMDEVARRAGVVKQTVYSYYPGKDALFSAVYERECRQIGRLLKVPPFTAPELISSRLERLGQEFIEILLSPSFRSLTRVTVAATRRFPDLGKLIYDGTIQPYLHQLAEILKDAMDRGLLHAGNPMDVALQFTALLRGELFFRCLLDPDFVPSKAAKARQVVKAVDCFVAKYGAATVVRPISAPAATKRTTREDNKKTNRRR